MPGTLKLNSGGAGNLILTPSGSVGSDVTMTVPAATGTMIYADASGNVGIGTSSPSSALDVQATDARSIIRLTATTSTNPVYSRASNAGGYLYLGRDGSAGTDFGAGAYAAGVWSTGAYPMVFGTNGTERMRINSSGYLYVGCTGGYLGDEWQRFSSGSSANNPSATMTVDNASSSPTGLVSFWSFTGATPNNTTARYVRGTDSSGVDKFVIYSNGTISNRTGTYNTLSDAKLKENVVDATPKLDKLMQAKVRNYNLIGDELKQIGFVAQELEQVFPGLVEDVPDFDENQQLTGEVTKMVKTSVLIPILVKAMQEQQEIINDLKARIETLESK